MGVVVEFQDLVRERQRRREQAVTQRCVEVIEASLDLEQRHLSEASERDRAVHLRRVEQLGELLDYVRRRG